LTVMRVTDSLNAQEYWRLSRLDQVGIKTGLTS